MEGKTDTIITNNRNIKTMKSFTQRLEDLRENAYLTIANSLTLIGEESHHNNQMIIPVPNTLQYNLDNGRWITEIGNTIIDNEGYQYSLSVLDTEKLFEIVDHIIDESKKQPHYGSKKI